MEIIQNQVLKLGLTKTHADAILSRITKSEKLGTDLLLNWGFTETSQAAYYLDAFEPDPALPQLPSPILRDYAFPSIFASPFKHQKTTASFLSLRSRAFCFNEAGTGKSASALWAADYLMGLSLVKHVLIICPMSVMYTVWQQDIFKTIMHRTAGVAYGDRKKRIEVVDGGYDFTIINYDGVATIPREIERERYDLIIVDEANAYKNSTTKRWKTLAKLINPSTRLWMMTGTPAAQTPEDAFGIAKMVSPQRVPKFKTAWRDKVMWQLTRFKWVPQTDSKQKVFNALQPAIRFTKKECLDLPPVLIETREVPLSAQAAAYYKKLKTQLLIEAAGETISAVNAGVAMSKLLQISGGAVYSDTKEILEFDISPRLAVLKEVLDECSNKCIVFVPYLHTIEVVHAFVTMAGYTSKIIAGSVGARARSDIINAFQNTADPKVLIIQPQAASHGVTLTAADTIVFWSPVMSVETRIQCIGRIDRVGQLNKMLVVDFVGSEVERKICKALQSKLTSHIELVELYKQVLLF